jgi:hypothetical protein
MKRSAFKSWFYENHIVCFELKEAENIRGRKADKKEQELSANNIDRREV